MIIRNFQKDGDSLRPEPYLKVKTETRADGEREQKDAILFVRFMNFSQPSPLYPYSDTLISIPVNDCF